MLVERPITTFSNLVGEPGTNNKKLYTYIKSMKCDGSSVSPLQKDWVNYSDPEEQTEILNDQSVSSFTKEDCTSLPQMGPGLTKTATSLVIQEKGVKKLLDG